ncbi:hypothetical protein Tco_0320646 [Tanacetum coccineum]
MTSKAQQIEMDNDLVAPENRHVIIKCNMRINPGMKTKEPTYQVVLDDLALTTCYPAFLITAEVPVIYTHQFWATFIKHSSSYRFKINNKRFFVNVEVFREIINICPKILGKTFDEPPTKEEALSFICELGHTGEIKYITNVIVDHLNQPWRTFASIINKCLFGKVYGLDKIRLSRVQILWGMYYKKNLDFVALIWEDLAYQIDNIDSKKQDKMFYPRFTKIIIHHFLTKDKSRSMRNRMFMDTARDDSLLGTMRFISRHADTQVYGEILPQAMTDQALLDSVAYKTYYAIASGAEPLKSRKSQKKSESSISSEESPSKKKPAKAKKDAATKPKPTKKKALVKADQGKGLNVLSEAVLFEAAQLKEAIKRSKQESHTSHASGSGDGTDLGSGVPDEKHRKTFGTDEGTSIKPGVPNVPKYDSESKKESWGDSDEEDDDDDAGDNDVGDNNDEQAEEEEEYSNERVHTPSDYELTEEENIDDEEEDDEVTKELYKDVNVNLETKDAKMTYTDKDGAGQHKVSQELGYEQVKEDAYVTLTVVHDTQKTDGTTQSSSVSSDLTSKLLNLDNPSPTDNTIASLMDTTVLHKEPSTTPTPTPTNSEATTSFPTLPDFSYVFKFNDRVTNLEKDLSEIKAEAQVEKQKYIDLVDMTVRAVIKEEVNTQLHQILPQVVLDVSTYEVATALFEFKLTKILIDKMEKNKSYDKADYKRELYDALVTSYQTDKDLFDTYGEVFSLKRSRDDRDKDQDPSAGSNRGTKRRKSSKEAESSRYSRSKEKKSSSTSKDASHSQHKPSGKSAHADKPSHIVDDLGEQQNQEFDTGYNDEQLDDKEASKSDWFKKPERPPTPDPDWNKRQHDYFINNNLEYLKGGDLSRRYLTSITKTKAATYELKWIEDMVPNLWSPIKVYDYGHLEKIEVRRDDQQLYTFKECDFPRLHIQDIEDMLLLLVQQKLTNLTIDERVESYQKKLNLTKADSYRSDLRNRTTYTAYSDPQGIIYVDQYNRNRLMRTNELHKVSDGSLNSVRTALHDIASRIRMEYLPKRK